MPRRVKTSLKWVATGAATSASATVVAWAQPGGWPTERVGLAVLSIALVFAVLALIPDDQP